MYPMIAAYNSVSALTQKSSPDFPSPLVLVMSVHPGFGGQGFLTESPKQIKEVREIIQQSGRKIWLEVDGGINKETAAVAVKAGADALVAGNAIFGGKDIAEALKQIKAATK